MRRNFAEILLLYHNLHLCFQNLKMQENSKAALLKHSFLHGSIKNNVIISYVGKLFLSRM